MARRSQAIAEPLRSPWLSPREAWYLALLVLLPLLAYARLAGAGFVWDDDTMLTANPLVHAGDGLRRIWLTTEATDYWPLTFSSFWLEWRIWGAWAPGYHLTNVVLHVVEGVLLWRFLIRLKVRGAAIAALWFALHPLNVESVAWIAQRKNLLAMLFFLVSLRSFAESSVVESGAVDRWCGLAWAAFVASLLSKGSTAPLPFLLLGWVLWRRRLRGSDAIWLGAFFLTAAVLAAVNVWFSHKSGGAVIRDIGWLSRFSGAGGAVWFYLGKIFWPVRLCFVYPQWTEGPRHLLSWLGFASALILTVALWLGRKHGSRPELGAWLSFVVMLLPVLGFTDVYFMRYSPVADHYAHLALLGVIVWAAARVTALRLPPGISWGVALALGVLTFRQTENYRDSVTLFRSVLSENPGCWMARYNLGLWYDDHGNSEEAGRQYEEALRSNPDLAEAHNNLGRVWSGLPSRLWEGIAQYREALRLKPDFVEAHYNLGNAWARIPGRLQDAAAEYQEALRIQPDFAMAHYNLGNAWADMPGRLQDAVAQYQEALRLRPDLADAHCNLANAWLKMPGRLSDAIAQYEEALRYRPDAAAIHFNFAVALCMAPGRTGDAAAQLETVLRLQPGNDTARQMLAEIRRSRP